jgi:UDP-N-acetylglucosamine diphosphorylase/glucosamine-1-phosphate N-acetyltransferase
MKKIVFTEEFCQPENFFPFTLTRQIQDIRVGILTIREKWELALDLPSFDKAEGDYKDLNRALSLDQLTGKETAYLIHGNILPTLKLVRQVRKLRAGEFITVPGKEGVVYCISKEQIVDAHKITIKKAIELDGELQEIHYPWDIFQMNATAIEKDFDLITKGRKGQKLSASNKVSNPSAVFLEKGAVVEHCIINAASGPVYIGRNALVMEGSIIRGPVSIGEGATVKMGAKIYGGTTIGPGCTAGGEIKNSVLFAISNKAHDGYLGDSVIGEWCNLGAGTSNSNLKNNASPVQAWLPSGPMIVGAKCGVLMGDYSRTAINTAINTGTVIGVCANVFGNGLTPKYIPSFSWGGDGVERYRFDKVLVDINNWKMLKGKEITGSEEIILKYIFDHY